MMKMSALDKLAYTLMVIGALDWGLVGFFKYDLVTRVFGVGFGRFIFAVVGLAGAWGLYGMIKMMSEQKKS